MYICVFPDQVPPSMFQLPQEDQESKRGQTCQDHKDRLNIRIHTRQSLDRRQRPSWKGSSTRPQEGQRCNVPAEKLPRALAVILALCCWCTSMIITPSHFTFTASPNYYMRFTHGNIQCPHCSCRLSSWTFYSSPKAFR